MEKTISTFLITYLFACSLMGQEVKTITQDYFGGKLTYQYYEDPATANQIKHGKIKFEQTEVNQGGSYKEVVTGQFKNGFRDGIWNFNLSKTDYPNGNGTYTTSSTVCTQTFKNGTPHGLWKLNESVKTRDKVFYLGTYVWGTFEPALTSYATANYNNGVLNGVITTKLSYKKTPNTATFNNNGFLTGNVIFKMPYQTEEMTFNPQGIMTRRMARDKAGNVLLKFEADKTWVEMAEKYLRKEISKKELQEKRIQLDTLFADDYTDLKMVFEHDNLLLKYLGGDKTYDTQIGKLNRNYGMFILVDEIAYIDLSKNQQYIEMRRNRNIAGYDRFIDENLSKLKPEDLALLKSEKERYYANKTHDENSIKNITTIKQFLENNNRYSKYKNSELQNFVYDKLESGISSVKELKSTLNEMVLDYAKQHNAAIQYYKTLDEYLNFDFKSLDEKTQEIVVEIETEIKPIETKMIAVLKKAYEADLKLYEVKSAYGKINVEDVNWSNNDLVKLFNIHKINSYGQNKAISGDEERLFKIHQEYAENKISSFKKEEKINDIVLDELIQISQKVIQLKGKDLKELIKETKKLKSVEEKIQLIIKF